MNEELILIHSADTAKKRFQRNVKAWMADLEGALGYVARTFGAEVDSELLEAALFNYDYFTARLRSSATRGEDKLEDWLHTAKRRYFTPPDANGLPVAPEVVREGNRLRPVLSAEQLAEALQRLDTYADLSDQGDYEAHTAIMGVVNGITALLEKDPDFREKFERDPGALSRVVYLDGQTVKPDPHYFRVLSCKLDRSTI